MRKIFALMVSVVCLLAACNKKEKPIEPVVSATIGNFVFYTSGKLVTTEKVNNTTYTSLHIKGVMSSGATIKLWIKNYTGALDTLMLDGVNASASYLPETPSIEVQSIHGQLIITAATPALTGIFNFVCSDSSFVSGDFKVAP